MAEKPRTRWCAIYTRKSSDEGLEQDFNSLDAQREAGEAYIKSQAHEGWRLYPPNFDDGGISGATLERPALKQLLAAIEAGQVQTVVVYKVDRLTRSLSDFAKLVDLFEKHGVSFVSVTQQFNTTTSMGRLMLNVLLSFAQFEREVTGERIRDKFLASRKKGMWMGGTPPLGYEIQNRKLVVNETEAAIVRRIFTRYAELRNVSPLKTELDASGCRTKAFTSSTGRARGGKLFSRGHLYHILKNRVYLGEAVHKGIAYPGEHASVIDQELWDRVHGGLATNRRGRGRPSTQGTGPLLTGLIFDDAGNRMTPMYGKKGERRYYYYVSQAVIRKRPDAMGSVPRLPAHDIDGIVAKVLLAHLAASPKRGAALSGPERYLALRDAIERATVLKNVVRLTLKSVQPQEDAEPSENGSSLDVPYELRRLPSGIQVINSDGALFSLKPSPPLIKALVRGYAWRRQLEQGDVTSYDELAREAGVTRRYMSRILRLGFLAPDLVEAILDGRQDAAVTTEMFRKPIPHHWTTQRAALGFGNRGT